MIGRYRAEIRADLLREYGVDLARWWRDRRWAGLLELIDQLPQASRLAEAQSNDPEAARLIAEARQSAPSDVEGEKWRPRLSEFDLHAVLLRDAIQAIVGVRSALIAVNGGQPGHVEPYPVPITEIDRQVERANREWANSIIDIFTPGKR